MKLLALDLATHLGFAFGDEFVVERHGSYRLPKTGENIGKFLAEYIEWLDVEIDATRPDQIVFESPILPATTNLATCRKLYGLCGITELKAQHRGVECREANLMDIRRHFIGMARAPSAVLKEHRRAWIKDRTQSVCRSKGFLPCDDNAADALALFSYVMWSADHSYMLRGREIARAA